MGGRRERGVDGEVKGGEGVAVMEGLGEGWFYFFDFNFFDFG